MIEAKPSATARRVALRRAAHQLIDAQPLVFEDPIALSIIDPKDAEALRTSPDSVEHGRFAPYMRAFLVVRSRVAEDALAEAVKRGVRQYVILGAGLDTFSYRNPYSTLHVFEVDFPATQAWKHERLTAGGIAIPRSVTFASIDFERQSVVDVLQAAGLDPTQPTFFSWLGVTMYLEPETTLATLKAIAPLTRGGGGIAFDYAVRPESLPPISRAAVAALSARVAEHGEPFLGYFLPEVLHASLSTMGFGPINDLGAAELNARFFVNRPDALRVGQAARILTAWA